MRSQEGLWRFVYHTNVTLGLTCGPPVSRPRRWDDNSNHYHPTSTFLSVPSSGNLTQRSDTVSVPGNRSSHPSRGFSGCLPTGPRSRDLSPCVPMDIVLTREDPTVSGSSNLAPPPHETTKTVGQGVHVSRRSLRRSTERTPVPTGSDRRPQHHSEYRKRLPPLCL